MAGEGEALAQTVFEWLMSLPVDCTFDAATVQRTVDSIRALPDEELRPFVLKITQLIQQRDADDQDAVYVVGDRSTLIPKERLRVTQFTRLNQEMARLPEFNATMGRIKRP